VAVCVVVLGTAASGAYRRLLAASEETYKGLRLFTEVIELIEQGYVDPVDSEKLIQGAIQGMVQSLDPHSSFLPPDAFKEIQIDTKGEFGGIGIVISMRDGYLTVIAPIEGTPAYKAGIKAGDRIVKVDGQSTQEMKLWEAVQKMRGAKGTTVVITAFREGFKEPKDFTLVRDIIPIESVRHIELKPGYAYVRITNFNESTLNDLKDALQDLQSGTKQVKGLIMDLRDNPGGLFPQAVGVADFFLESGVIVSIKGRDKSQSKVYRARTGLSKPTYPLVVLINGGSASASEIVAGALQDHKRALVIGTSSFGKGSVQTLERLRDGYGLKLTVARYYTPSGKSIQAQGIVPDIVVSPGSEKEPAAGKGLRRVKEKDLKNHLEPEFREEEAQEPSPEPEEPGAQELPEGGYGQLLVERLLMDHQVGRALEILMGHSILTGSES